MNFSHPILICNQNEDFRLLLRDMLTKYGYFHLLEANDATEAVEILRGKNDFFILVEAALINSTLTQAILRQNNFLVLVDRFDESALKLTSELGINHMMAYPFHSRKLMDKMNSLI